MIFCFSFFSRIISFVCKKANDKVYLRRLINEFVCKYANQKFTETHDLILLIARAWPKVLCWNASEPNKNPVLAVIISIVSEIDYRSFNQPNQNYKLNVKKF